MALTQRLEFRQSQSLVMTPQLMQAIKLLQLSNLDLAAFVEEELERNPLLDRANEDGNPADAANNPALNDASQTTARDEFALGGHPPAAVDPVSAKWTSRDLPIRP